MYVAFHKTGTCFCFFLSCQAAAAGKEKTSFALSSLRSRPGADYPACFSETCGFAFHSFMFPFKSKAGRPATFRLLGF